MLYPDLKDLISYKQCKRDKARHVRRKMHTHATGQAPSPFRGRGLNFDAVREYVLGDDIRNIDWKVTARTGSAHLKLFQEDKQRHTTICVDMNAAMRFGTRGTFKSIQAARCAALLGWQALHSQDRLHACLFGDVIGGLQNVAFKDTRKALSGMFKTLTQAPAETHLVSLETVLQHLCRSTRTGSLIYLISDFMDLSPALLQNLSFMRLNKRCDLVLIAINDPSDQALTSAGVVGFSGEHTNRLLINTDSLKGRAAYSAAWEANRHALKTITNRYQIPLISLTTESVIQYDLLLALKTLSRGKTCRL